MSLDSTNLRQAAALLANMTAAELEQLRVLAKQKIEQNHDDFKPCHFLALSAELRNHIYTFVTIDQVMRAVDEGQQNGLAVANKQISKEYLSILNSKRTVRAKYLASAKAMEWVEIDAHKLLTAWSLQSRDSSEQGLYIYYDYSTRDRLEKHIIKNTNEDNKDYRRHHDRSRCSFFGMLEIVDAVNGCFMFEMNFGQIKHFRSKHTY